ncbi:HalOD1 output domain-containing protein [Haloarcula sp. JP-L23]|uniref:HalOD1 output domain-containing protein n=1 Tax=Haloarcula sp. JP-L23 TaxID=2716717 RepID=UPI00140F3F54|nr:hypothetical protein G9465_01405 [Haloarcula sp. JP-L23]
MIGTTPEPNENVVADGPDSLVVTISEKLAAERGVSPRELPALNDYVNVDALASLFNSPGSAHLTTSGRVRFQVEHNEIQVDHDGTVSVRTLGAESSPVETVQD